MLSTQPYKGVRDFFPSDWAIQNYIFDTWKKVCTSFGYEEYNSPFLEPFEIYAAKTGQEIVNDQLYYFTDRGDRKVAIRPEMTPSVSRMAAAKIQDQSSLPLKWFSIANFYRYERPQKSRGREFFQLNIDIFGEESILADLECLNLNNEIMKAFGSKTNMYQVRVNNRFFIDYILTEEAKLTKEQQIKVAKAIDKSAKISQDSFTSILKEAEVSIDKIQIIKDYLKLTVKDLERYKDKSKGANGLLELLALVEEAEIPSVVFDPSIVRGLDYYDGNIFEQFDMTPDNNRSMFGGGRYDGLVSLFIGKKVPAVGFAPGDMALLEFLKSWNLVPELKTVSDVLVTIFPENKDCMKKSWQTAQELRKNFDVELFLEEKTDLSKQIKYADKKEIPFVIIIGPEELEKNLITVKNMQSGSQSSHASAQEIIDIVRK